MFMLWEVALYVGNGITNMLCLYDILSKIIPVEVNGCNSA